MRMPYHPPPCIVVPVYNAVNETVACLHAVIRETSPPYRILVLDDASPDPDVPSALSSLAERFPILELFRNEHNLGFAANVNQGIALAQGDVVLLNSDTVVSRNWLDKLVACAYSRVDAATVTPLSNAAGAFSTPINNCINELPAGLDVNAMARVVSRVANATPVEAPTGNGFCLYIRRDAIERIGVLDANAFPYVGEENDFGQRAIAARLVNLVDSSCYVYHKRSASFGGEETKAKKLAVARTEIDRRYPTYRKQVRVFLRSRELASCRTRLGSLLGEISFPVARGGGAGPDVRPRLLSVVHDGGGGLVYTNMDLMHALAGTFETFVLRCGMDNWKLTRVEDGGVIAEWKFGTRWRSFESTDVPRRMALRSITEVLEIDLVHIRTLICTGPEILSSIRGGRAAILVSFHDFNAICPTTHLVDDAGRYCAGHCTPGEGDCPVSPKWFGDVQSLKHSGVYNWRIRMAANLPLADAFVTTSEGAKRLLVEHFGVLSHRQFSVIEHGRDRDEVSDVAVPPGTPLRVVVLGAVNLHKGALLLKSILELNSRRGGGVEFHVVGETPRRFRHRCTGVTWHGGYERNELIGVLRGISPSYALMCSIWPETYSHTLTEAWMAGLPVVASDIGATAERIRNHGGGCLVDPETPELWLEKLGELGNVERWQAMRNEVRGIVFRSTGEMAREYEELYREVLGRMEIDGAVAGVGQR